MSNEAPRDPFDTPEMRDLNAKIEAGQRKSIDDSINFLRTNTEPVVFGSLPERFASPAAKEIGKLMEPQNHSGAGAMFVVGRIAEECKALGYSVAEVKDAQGRLSITLTPPQR